MPLSTRRAVSSLALAAGASLLVRPASAESAVTAEAPGMAEVLDPASVPRPVFQSGLWCEGPVWAPRLGGLVFSDVRRSRVLSLRPGGGADRLRDPSNNTNGNGIDGEERLLCCEHLTRQVVRVERNGSITVLADRFDGRRLNSPNDLAVARDGAVWFTDPTYGLVQPNEGRQGTPEQRGRFVFRLDPSGRLDVADDGFEQPNGIVFSPDGRRLFVSETSAALNPEGGREIRVFDVGDDGRLARGRVFARPAEGVPDGLDVDVEGRVYAATAAGVQVWNAQGDTLGRIAVPGTAGNLTFGGARGTTLFVCNGACIHAVEVRTRGAHWRG